MTDTLGIAPADTWLVPARRGGPWTAHRILVDADLMTGVLIGEPLAACAKSLLDRELWVPAAPDGDQVRQCAGCALGREWPADYVEEGLFG